MNGVGAVMAKRFFEAYNEVPDGTQCHRKTYITTALGGLCGELGPEGGGREQRSEGTRRSRGAGAPGRVAV